MKTDAFRLALAGEDSELVEIFIEYHKKNGGVSRNVKFEYFYRNLKKQYNPSRSISEALVKYSDICKEGLVSCKTILGVENFLVKLGDFGLRSFVVSGGNQEELREAFHIKHLDHYFVDILGSPRSKKQIITNLLEDLEGPSLYFGDAFLDYQVAIENRMNFVFISGKSDWFDGELLCKSSNLPVYKNFTEILQEVSGGIANNETYKARADEC